jgi:phage regulator Rha-like protein
MDRNLNITSNVKIPHVVGGSTVPTITSREIAVATDKEHKTVLRDIRNMLESLYGEDGTDLYHPGVAVERDARNYIAVITLDREHAMTLATGYDVKLRKRVVDKLASYETAKAMTPAEMLFEQARMMVEVERKQAALEVEQIEQASRIATTERRLDQIETATDHFTCVGYARWAKQMSIDLKQAADLGRRATKRCRELGIPISKIPDPRFGAVNQFPKAILDEVWEEMFGRAA